MKKVLCYGVLALLLCFGLGARNAQAATTTENLLVSTELLLISQANLAILALTLIQTDMEHDYTTVEQDKENLNNIVESLDLSQETIKTLLGSKTISKNDLAMIKLLSKVNEELMSGTKELVSYCDDNDAGHFATFADNLNDVATNMGKVGEMLSD